MNHANSSSSSTPSLGALCIQNPSSIPQTNTMSQPIQPLQPPMNPPPFQPATVRRCIKTSVRIQNHDRPQEVLILTSVNSSVDSILSVGDPNSTNYDNVGDGEEMDREEMDGDSSSDFSDFSDSTSSSSSEEADGRMPSVSNDDNMDGNMAQDANPPGYKMRAFWLSKRPLCEVIFIFFISTFASSSKFIEHY